MYKSYLSYLIFSFLCMSFLLAQEAKKSAGPLIEDYGAVWDVPDPGFETKTDIEYRVMFDIYKSPSDPSKLNLGLNSLARFMNMHAKAGVPAENIKAVAIVHNQASWDMLMDDAYEEKYGVPNPNRELIVQLKAAGAQIYQCGQSLYSREVPRDQLLSEVDVALSAMTVILNLQKEGYQLIKF
ncbi:MAG: DsrE family protein [Bacteroidota bacterium]